MRRTGGSHSPVLKRLRLCAFGRSKTASGLGVRHVSPGRFPETRAWKDAPHLRALLATIGIFLINFEAIVEDG